MPQISIITPAFNAAATIAETIRSAQAQSFTDWELIVIDDHSNDGTGAIVEHFSADDPRIRLIRRAENGGSAKARNQGIKAANGRYLAFIDADDLWLPEKLTRQLAFMQDNAVTLSYHAYRRFYPNGKLGRVLKGANRVTFDTLLRQTSVGMLTVMIDRERSEPIQFPDSIAFCEDLCLWLDLTKAGQDIVFLNEDLARYRISATAKSSRILRNQFQVWRAYRKHGGLTKMQTLFALLWHGFHGVWKRVF